MSSIGSGYDLDASQFSPDGRVFQVEYASKAVENSGNVIGMRNSEGVVFAVENIITSKLYVQNSVSRIFTVDEHIGMAVAGFLSDSRHLVSVARSEASDHRYSYGSPISVKYLSNRLSMYMHAHTLYGMIRPFGCSVALGSCFDGKPELLMIEPSGVCYGYDGCAMGKASQNGKTEIEKLKLNDFTLPQLVREAARIIYVVHDEVKDKNFELELSWIGKETNYKHEKVPTAVYQAAEEYAKVSLQDSDDELEEDKIE